MKYIDPKLGVPLPERDYGGNCLIYDPGNTSDPLHNLWVRLPAIFFTIIVIVIVFSLLLSPGWNIEWDVSHLSRVAAAGVTWLNWG